jgi:hypothetical protein
MQTSQFKLASHHQPEERQSPAEVMLTSIIPA